MCTTATKFSIPLHSTLISFKIYFYINFQCEYFAYNILKAENQLVQIQRDLEFKNGGHPMISRRA